MSTNYYAVREIKSGKLCPHCGKVIVEVVDREDIHIGCSSVGWLFAFQETAYYDDFPSFLDFIDKEIRTGHMHIEDEYGEYIDPDEFIAMIHEMQCDPYNLRNKENYSYGFENRSGYRFLKDDFC